MCWIRWKNVSYDFCYTIVLLSIALKKNTIWIFGYPSTDFSKLLTCVGSSYTPPPTTTLKIIVLRCSQWIVSTPVYGILIIWIRDVFKWTACIQTVRQAKWHEVTEQLWQPVNEWLAISLRVECSGTGTVEWTNSLSHFKRGSVRRCRHGMSHAAPCTAARHVVLRHTPHTLYIVLHVTTTYIRVVAATASVHTECKEIDPHFTLV